MRVTAQAGDFRVKAIAGTKTVLLAFDCPEGARHGLLGFAVGRNRAGSNRPTWWLGSFKVFKSLVPDPLNAKDPADPTKPARFTTYEHPVQSFLWGDYALQADTAYRYTVVPMYGAPGALVPHEEIVFEVHTEKEIDGGHGVWFNMGAIAGQAFARRFQNQAPTEAEQNDPENEQVRWLSRGLLDACLAFIRDTPAGDALRVAAYEFTYKPVLDELERALDRGVDVQIIYHDTTGAKGKEHAANEDAIAASHLPKRHGNRTVLHPRAKTKIPHNKFIVRLEGGTHPTQVWTGSTNFTPSGFLGQTNVGHLVIDATVAHRYLDLWRALEPDPDRDTARAKAMALTPDPPAVPAAGTPTMVFSPRTRAATMLDWYGDRIEDATRTVMFTAAFGVNDRLVGPLASDRDFLRFVLAERPPTEAQEPLLDADPDLLLSYGSVLGETYVFKDGKPVTRRKIIGFDLDKWYLTEEHYRKINEGFVFFVHAKFLLIDPLSDDPLVCSGSANFSDGSLLSNDENMLLIRGDTRVADIYLTEFDRIFRHFYARDVIDELEAEGKKAKKPFLAETSRWTATSFKKGAFKYRRRELFFAAPERTWVDNANARG